MENPNGNMTAARQNKTTVDVINQYLLVVLFLGEIEMENLLAANPTHLA